MAKGIPIETRLDLLIRIVGLIFLSFGIVLAFFTATAPLVPQITSSFYFISLLLSVSGFIVLIAKMK